MKKDYSFLASGNVIKHFSGMPCFPVRLSLELFERAYHLIGKDKISVYDPCCGNGFSLTVLGMMKQGKISSLYGSDIDEYCIEATGCNLNLLTREKLIAAAEKVFCNDKTTETRKVELKEAVNQILPYLTSPPDSMVFGHDILLRAPNLPQPINYLFADIPYGNMTEWITDRGCEDPVQSFLQNVTSVISENGILVICGSKNLRIQTKLYRKVDKFRVGKRLIFMFQKNH